MASTQTKLQNLNRNMKTPIEILNALKNYVFLVLLAVASLAPPDGHCQMLNNPDFSMPSLGGSFYQYQPVTNATQRWTFSGGLSGVARDGGGADTSFAVADINYPSQYAFLQLVGKTAGIISQMTTFGSAGLFDISYLEAGRVRAPSGAGGDLQYTVTLSNVSSGVCVLSQTNQSATGQRFRSISHRFLIEAPGDYLLSFQGVSHSGPYQDDTVLIDSAVISPAPAPLTLTIVLPQGGMPEVRLCWNSVTNVSYQLQYRSDLTTGTWTAFGNPIQGSAETICVTDSLLPSQPTGFYRLEQLQ